MFYASYLFTDPQCCRQAVAVKYAYTERSWYLLRQRVKSTSYTWSGDQQKYDDGHMMQLLRVDQIWVTDKYAPWFVQLCSSPSGRNTWQLVHREEDGLPQLNALMYSIPPGGDASSSVWHGKDATGCIWYASHQPLLDTETALANDDVRLLGMASYRDHPGKGYGAGVTVWCPHLLREYWLVVCTFTQQPARVACHCPQRGGEETTTPLLYAALAG